MNRDSAYWISIAHLPRWGYLNICRLINKIFNEYKISIGEFFDLSETDWKDGYELNDKQVADLKQAKSELASNAFLAESLLNQGYEIIPLISPEYPEKLKLNLKSDRVPGVIYVKGNKKILSEKSVAIVGSRNASDTALKFTDNIAKQASKEFRVVVSGFAPGVDKRALDSAMNYKGQSIIVLPQGIMTFGSGFKNYYRQIVEGNVLVLSIFFPKAPWRAELAMARNPIIYGLADEIFVSESSEKGGTWSGAIDGLRKGRRILVRMPELNEKNANQLLIDKGAIPVDFNGKEIARVYESTGEESETLKVSEFDLNSFKTRVTDALKNKPMSSKELLSKLGLNWTTKKLNSHLKKLEFVEVVKVKRLNLFRLKAPSEETQESLFA